MRAKKHRRELEACVNDFLRQIEKELARQKITRVEFACRMGCTPSNITRVMKNGANLTLTTMLRMAQALHCTLHVRIDPHWFDDEKSS